MIDTKADSFAAVVRILGEAHLAEFTGAKRHQPRDWRIRDNIPSEWWASIVQCAAMLGREEITLDLFAQLAAQKLEQKRAGAVAAE